MKCACAAITSCLWSSRGNEIKAKEDMAEDVASVLVSTHDSW